MISAITLLVAGSMRETMLREHELVDVVSIGAAGLNREPAPTAVSCSTPNNTAYRGSSDFDARHNFNANVLYELPFGRGKFKNTTPLLNEIVGGWQISLIQRYRSGLPSSVYYGGGRHHQYVHARPLAFRIASRSP